MNFVAMAECYCLIYWCDNDAFVEAAWVTPADFDDDNDDDDNNNDNDSDRYDRW